MINNSLIGQKYCSTNFVKIPTILSKIFPISLSPQFPIYLLRERNSPAEYEAQNYELMLRVYPILV